MYHGIGALDPEKLNVFRTVREITGKMQPHADSQQILIFFTHLVGFVFVFANIYLFVSYRLEKNERLVV